MDKPIIALDVDGVLNILTDKLSGLKVHYVRASRTAGGKSVPLEIVDKKAYQENRKDRINSQKFDTERKDYSSVYRLAFNPNLPELLEELSLLGELVWATTWENYANSFISPLVGLPSNLPVIEFGEARNYSSNRLFWKTQTILKYAGDRRFVWFDDEIKKIDNLWIKEERGKNHSLAVHVGKGAGLRKQDVELAKEFLSKAPLS